MPPKTLLTGIKPTGTIHIGNYVGAIRPMVDLATDTDTDATFAFIADLHALNAMRDAEQVKKYTRQVAAAWIAGGLDGENIALFRQSDIWQIPYLSTLLMNMTAKGHMNRAHAYKAMVDENMAAGKDPDDGVNMGLYTYPILMAADILAYDATHVPVGEDQRQHVEITRDIVTTTNHLYGDDTLTLPEPVVLKGESVPGLDGRKMSKSYGNIIPLFAPMADIKKACMSVVTDSRTREESKEPESVTIFNIYKHVAKVEEVAEMRAGFADGGLGYGDAKKQLFSAMERLLAPMRNRFDDLMSNPDELDSILVAGAKAARGKAEKTLTRLKSKMLGHP
jgi:tryptophanyl-tRNA synthetase